MATYSGFPAQRISSRQKTKSWCKKCVDFADNKMLANKSYIRRNLESKEINYDLLQGKIHMSDIESLLNPEGIKADFIPDKIPHYPIMNSKLNVLRGEEFKRVFDYRVVVTNPTAISEIEEQKSQEIFQRLQEMVSDQSQNEDEYMQQIEKLNDYYSYSYQDIRELRANCLLNHYVKELDLPILFNRGFVDAMAVGEECYFVDIEGGEPAVHKVNPKKLQAIKMGFSNKLEDADMIIYDDYWSMGRIIDVFGEKLNASDIKYLEELATGTSGTSQNDDFDDLVMKSEVLEGSHPLDHDEYVYEYEGTVPCANDDSSGNIRVLRVFWKSLRIIKKVKSFDPVTGEEIVDFYTDQYQCDEALGEVEETLTVNEAWEGVKLANKIYVNLGPRKIQYNRLSNPSRCHFGFIGSFYNINEEKTYSLVDMMKQYNYWYDVIHHRLNRLIAGNWGKLVRLDLSKKPNTWKVEKWLYYAKNMGLFIEDSFNAGTEGYATGKLAGAMNSASSGVIDAELGNTIQQYTNLLEYIKIEMAEVAGITKQREGQISNRETVGGVERATLQSSHITEWLFLTHDDIKKRVLECILETAKICLRGRTKKFSYVLPGMTTPKVMSIDGDEFCESDYGLLVDNSDAAQTLNSKIETLAQAALQNHASSFSTIFKLYGTASLAEKQRLIEIDERNLKQEAQQQQQQQLEAQQQALQAQSALEQQKLALQDQMNQRDNETKLLIATMSSIENEVKDVEAEEYSQADKDKLQESIREFDEKIKLDRERLEFDKSKARTDAELKNKQINMRNSRSSS